jgi:hypothetical protein
MLLRRHSDDPQAFFATGQLLLVAGLAGQIVVRWSSDPWAGFLAGLSGTLIGASIFFNVRGLVLWRGQRDDR